MNKNVIFFHNDLDGIMSALYLSIALNKNMNYISAHHGIKINQLIEKYKEYNYNIYVVDFPPNRLATLNIDHHSSNSSVFDDMKKSQKIYDPDAPSCAGIIARHYGLHEYKNITDLVNKVDSFGWSTPEEAASLRYDYIFSKLMLDNNKNIDYCMKKALKILKTNNTIDFFKRASELIFSKAELEKQIKKELKHNDETRKIMDNNVYKNFILLKSNTEKEYNRNLAYIKGYDGVISEYKVKDRYHVAVVVNEFKYENNNIDVSKICKEFGGGGHKLAAGYTSLSTISQEEFRAIVDKILEQL